jgi:hypothetical protein
VSDRQLAGVHPNDALRAQVHDHLLVDPLRLSRVLDDPLHLDRPARRARALDLLLRRRNCGVADQFDRGSLSLQLNGALSFDFSTGRSAEELHGDPVLRDGGLDDEGGVGVVLEREVGAGP